MNIPADSTGITGFLLPTTQQPCDTAGWSVIGSAPDSTCLATSPMSSLAAATMTPAIPDGDAGEPLPYSLAGDSVAVGLWLLGLIVLTAMFLRMRSLIRAGWWQAVKASDAEMPSLALHWWDYLLTFLSCSVMLTFSAYAVSGLGAEASDAAVPTWLIAAAATGLFLVVLFLRLGIQSWVNAVFWKHDVVSQWCATFLLATSVAAVMLFFTGISAVYIADSLPYVPYMLAATYVLFKIFILFSEISIFSSAKTSFSHIILYICTLEIMPLFFLWKGAGFLGTSTILKDIL